MYVLITCEREVLFASPISYIHAPCYVYVTVRKNKRRGILILEFVVEKIETGRCWAAARHGSLAFCCMCCSNGLRLAATPPPDTAAGPVACRAPW